MKHVEQLVFALDNFEGPIDFLYHLAHRNEVDLSEVPLKKLTEQYLLKLSSEQLKSVDAGAEFVGTIALLLFMKSRLLLPHQAQPAQAEEHPDPKFDIIHQLVDYCKFKEAARSLSERESKQSVCFPRGVEQGEAKRMLGIEHLSIDDFTTLFNEILKKAARQTEQIPREVWEVSDKIIWMRHILKEQQQVSFETLFSFQYSREELVVTFLALLELMKMGEAFVGKEELTERIIVCEYGRKESHE